MELKINGKWVTIDGEKSVLEVLSGLKIELEFVAVAVNQECLCRNEFAETRLKPRDEIEILVPYQGG